MSTLPLKRPCHKGVIRGLGQAGLHSRPRRSKQVLCLQGLRRTDAGANTASFIKGLPNPQQLLSAEGREATVWTLRFFTGRSRGSALSESTAGVQVCLVGQTGDAVLHRISAHRDAASECQDLLDICKAAGKQLSATCSAGAREALTRLTAASAHAGSRTGKVRFKQGSVDEISFLGAELGPLASLLVGPEHGSWFVEEITVLSSRTTHQDRFICRYPLGDGKSYSNAALLSPVPEDHVVYGSGADARVVSQTQARILHAAGMKGYLHLKAQLLYATALLVVTGSVGAYALDGLHAALPFALGGLGGVLYQLLLQQGADAIPGGMLGSRQSYVPGALLRRATRTPASRFLFTIATVLAVGLVSDNLNPPHVQPLLQGRDGMHHMAMAGLGFLMFKLAVVGVAMLPSDSNIPVLDKKAS